MRDWERLKERYLCDGVPVRLGELASTLSRIKSFSREIILQEAVEQMIEESKFFIEWTVDEVEPNVAIELNELHTQLICWQRDFLTNWHDSTRRAKVSQQARIWSDRILERSGLLSKPASTQN
jgi:hypothetical protein